MPCHVMPPEAERFMHSPPPQQAAGPDLSGAWNQMQAGRAMGSDMLRAQPQSPAGGWSAEFDSVAQIARPPGQQNMPMQSNRTSSVAV